MSTDDAGLADRLRKQGMSNYNGGDLALARVFDLCCYLKACLVRLANGGPVVISDDELRQAAKMELDIEDSKDDDQGDGEPGLKFTVRMDERAA